MVINVTQEHINHGIKRNCNNCPVALALKEATNAEQVSVSEIVLSYTKDNDTFISDTPLKASNFINNFDHHQEVKPFEFEVNFREL